MCCNPKVPILLVVPRFFELVNSSVEGEGYKIDYEYEHIENGDKVVLGKGSLGTVFFGVDMVTRKEMAIKEIPIRDETDERYVNMCSLHMC